MTNEQKLKKIIEKAIEGGYLKGKEVNSEIYAWNILMNGVLNTIIFDKDFAKAFWKDCGKMINYCEGSGCQTKMPTWKWHLRELVLEDNKIDYLYKFIN